MSHNLRNRVLLLLKAVTSTEKHELFNKAFELYKETPEKHQAIEVKLNRIGFTDDNLQHLLYDLQKMHGISDTEIVSATSPEELKSEEIKIATSNLVNLQSAKKKNKKAIETAQNKVDDLKAELEGLENPIIEEFKKEEEIPGIGINEHISDFAQKILPFTDEVKEVKEGFKVVEAKDLQPIRDEFPFLNDKDCPDVMFIVVGKKVSAYRRYQELHAKLQEALDGRTQPTTEEQVQLATDTQDAFSENRALWNELNYYNEHKEILGKHPLFRELVAKREVETMTMEQLAKYLGSSAKFLSEKRKALTDASLPEDKKAKITEAIVDREFRLGLVNTKLGADGKK